MDTPSLKRWGFGNRANITRPTRNILDGLLLGDGYYGTPSKYSSFFRLNQIATHQDWVLQVRAKLLIAGIKCSFGEVPANIRTTRAGAVIRASASVYIQSASYRDLLHERSRWYMERRKVLPEDIEISDGELLAQWYMGDGNFSVHPENKSINVRLHTNSFSEAEVRKLSEDFYGRLGMKTTINHWRRQPILCIQNENASRFLDLIRAFICPSFLYKAPIDCWKPAQCEVCGVDLAGRPRFSRLCYTHRRERLLMRNRERARAYRKNHAPVA